MRTLELSRTICYAYKFSDKMVGLKYRYWQNSRMATSYMYRFYIMFISTDNYRLSALPIIGADFRPPEYKTRRAVNQHLINGASDFRRRFSTARTPSIIGSYLYSVQNRISYMNRMWEDWDQTMQQ